jgi:hypothetical protein
LLLAYNKNLLIEFQASLLRGNHKRYYLLLSNKKFPIEFAASVLCGNHKKYLLQVSNKNLLIELREMNASGTTIDISWGYGLRTC